MAAMTSWTNFLRAVDEPEAPQDFRDAAERFFTDNRFPSPASAEGLKDAEFEAMGPPKEPAVIAFCRRALRAVEVGASSKRRRMSWDGEKGRATDDLGRMMDTTYWWGIPTLFRTPMVTDPSELDIALVGVPHSSGNGTTLRDQHLGPRSVRDISARWRRVHSGYKLDPWSAPVRIGDVGDVPLPEANNNEKCIERMTDFYARLDRDGVRPVSIGGDHSITGGIIQGLQRYGTLSGGKKLSLLHFDAHTDTFDQLEHFMGAVKSAAHWGAYLVKQGMVDATKSVQIGIRGHTRSLDWLQSSHTLGYRVISYDNYVAMGEDAVLKVIDERIGDNPVYITLDLDCFDASVAPGVSNLEMHDGFKFNQVAKMIQRLQGRNVVGGDVVCCIPTLDNPCRQTSHVAAAMMFEILALLVDNNLSSKQKLNEARKIAGLEEPAPLPLKRTSASASPDSDEPVPLPVQRTISLA